MWWQMEFDSKSSPIITDKAWARWQKKVSSLSHKFTRVYQENDARKQGKSHLFFGMIMFSSNSFLYLAFSHPYSLMPCLRWDWYFFKKKNIFHILREMWRKMSYYYLQKHLLENPNIFPGWRLGALLFTLTHQVSPTSSSCLNLRYVKQKGKGIKVPLIQFPSWKEDSPT